MATINQTVFVVDDDEAVRDSLQTLLRSVGLHSEAYASGSALLAALDLARPGCLITDVRMPGMSGLDLVTELRQRGAMLPIIFITGHGDVPMAVEAMRLGALDFIQKPFRDQQLLDRVYGALSEDRQRRNEAARTAEICTRLSTLTPRESQVLDLLLDGKANKVIALALQVSQRTVEIHRARIMAKTKAESLAELVKMVVLARPEYRSDSWRP